MKMLLILSMLLLTGCASLVAKPEVTLKDVKFAGLDSKNIGIDVYLSVHNPNSFDLSLKNYSYDISIVSLPVAKGNAEASYDFYADSTTDILVPVKIPFSSVFEILKRTPDPDAIPYQVHAELTIGRGIASLTVPVTKSGTLAVPKELYSSALRKKVGDFLKGLGGPSR